MKSIGSLTHNHQIVIKSCGAKKLSSFSFKWMNKSSKQNNLVKDEFPSFGTWALSFLIANAENHNRRFCSALGVSHVKINSEMLLKMRK